MKNKIILAILSILFVSLSLTKTEAQVTNKIQADSVKVYQVGGHSAELIIENATRSRTNGVLKNTGNGRTQFDYVVDSTWVIDSIMYVRRGPVTSQYNIKAGLGTISGSGIDSLLSQNSVIGTGKTSNKFRLNRDTTVTTNTKNIVYGFQGDNTPHYYVNTPDTGSLAGQMRMSHFASIAALKASNYHSFGFKMALTQSYYGDTDRVSGAKYVWVDTSTAVADDMFAIKPSSVSGAGRWLYVAENGVFNLRALGCKNNSDNSHFNFDNQPIIQYVINHIPTLTPAKIYLPASPWAKAYYCDTTIDFSDKEITFFTDGHNTRLMFPAQTLGIRYSRTIGNDFATFENIHVYSFIGSDPSYQYDGFRIEAVCRMLNCSADYFSGAGLKLQGTIGGSGTNISGSYVRGFNASSCGDGVAIIGDDANAVDLMNLDTRDCARYGVRNAAFLTLNIFGWMSHYAAAGDYNSSDLNCSTVLVGPYWEGGSPVSTVRGRMKVVGGNIPDNQLVRQTILDVVDNNNSATFKNISNSYGDIAIKPDEYGNAALYLEGYPTNGPRLRNRGGLIGNESNWQWEAQQDTSWKMGGIMGYNTLMNWNGVSRFVRMPLQNLESAIMQGRYVQSQTSLSNINPSPYLPGDIVYIRPYDSSQVHEYVCIKAGSIPTHYVFATNPNGTDTLFSVSGHSFDNVGENDVIIYHGVQRTIIKRGGDQPFWVKLDGTVPASSSADTVYYVDPIWKEVGPSTGTTSQRPTISNHGIGYMYFNTDSAKYQTWTGTIWVTLGGSSGGTGATAFSSLTDVNISSPSNLQVAQYQTSDSKWHNHTLAVADISDIGTTYVPQLRTITINGTTYDLSANRSWTVSGSGSFGTAGQIPYTNTSGLSYNYTNHLRFDSANNYLYVGDATISPTAGIVKVAARDAEGKVSFVYGTVEYGYVSVNTSTGIMKVGSDYYPLRLYSEGTQVLNFYSGNVGVGMQPINPGPKLDVNGSIGNHTNSYFYYLNGSHDVSAGYPTYSFTDDKTNGWYSTSPSTQSWSTGGVERLRLDSNRRFSVSDSAFRIVGIAGDPSSPSNGDIWHNTSTNHLKVQLNGTTYQLDQQGGMTNPMTTSGDIIYGGSSGTPQRLAAGTNGYILTMNAGVPSWNSGATWSGLVGGGSISSSAGPFSVTSSTQYYINTGSSASTYNLPALATNRYYYFKNAGSSTMDIVRNGTDVIWSTSSITTLTLNAGESVLLVGGASSWYAFFQSSASGLSDPGSNGILVRTALNTTVARSMDDGVGITWTNPTGVGANPQANLKGWEAYDKATVQTTNTTVTSVVTLGLPNDGSGTFVVELVGTKTDNTKSIEGRKTAHWHTTAGTLTIDEIVDDNADYLRGFTTADWTIDASAGTIRIRVNGEPSTTIDWSATYKLKYNSYAL